MKAKGLRIHFVLFTILLLCGLLLFVFKDNYAQWFASIGFQALQEVKCTLLHQSSFSLGDWLYLFIFLISLYCTYKLFKNKFWRSKLGLVRVVFVLINFSLGNAIILYLVWGALYQQPKLALQLSLDPDEKINQAQLFQFDKLLIHRLNELAPEIDSFTYQRASDHVAILYHLADIHYPLIVKRSLWGGSLSYLGIEGYFNPLSGEAQINPNLPHFMLPFVVAHEMAHQCGIAAEDDANLMAYIRCVESNNKTIQYAAYFNIWLYTQRKCYQLDSNAALSIRSSLNSVSLQHLELLKERNKKYHTILDDWSGYLFDLFLKMGNQQEGIASYDGVVQWAWLWERKQKQISP